MKFSSKLAMFGAVAGLSAAQVVSADEAAPEISICEEAPVTGENSEEVIDEPTVDEEVTDKEVVDEKVSDEEVTEEEVTEEDGEVPLDWVKRGGDGENPDVIFYNMAGGGPAGGPASNDSTNDAGKDGAPTAVEAKTVAPVAPIVKAKKGPVALVKGARVFLRH